MNKNITVEAVVYRDDTNEALEDTKITTEPTIDTNLPVVRNRASKAERIQRVQVVLNLLAEGMPRYRIVDELFRMYGVSERQSDIYLADAYCKLQQSFKNDVEANKAQSIEWYFQTRNRCIQDGEYSAAIQCQSQMDKIKGLVTPKVDITGQINIVTIDKQDEQL